MYHILAIALWRRKEPDAFFEISMTKNDDVLE